MSSLQYTCLRLRTITRTWVMPALLATSLAAGLSSPVSAGLFEDIGNGVGGVVKDVGRAADGAVNGVGKGVEKGAEALGCALVVVGLSALNRLVRSRTFTRTVERFRPPPSKTTWQGGAGPARPRTLFWQGVERACKLVRALERRQADQQALNAQIRQIEQQQQTQRRSQSWVQAERDAQLARAARREQRRTAIRETILEDRPQRGPVLRFPYDGTADGRSTVSAVPEIRHRDL